MQETQEMQAPSLGPGRSPGGGNGNLLQYCCLENSMDRGTWDLEELDTTVTEHTRTML